jgi:DNA polymerase-2
MPRGFILQPTYRIEAGRPVVHLYGTLESGGSFLVRDTRQTPHFWIRAADVERARQLGAEAREEAAERRTMDDEPVRRVEVATPPDVPPLRDRLVAAGVPCFEADVRFALRHLIERGIRSAIEITGDPRPGDGVDAVFDDPEIAPARWIPTLSVLSFDIETDPQAGRLLSVALVGAGASEVLLLTPEGADVPRGATPCPTEAELLRAFVDRVRAIDPDVLTGWNVVDFDLAVLDRLARRAGVPLTIGRGPEPLRLREANAPRAARRASIPGRLVMDGIDLLRGAFVKLDDYSLNGAARAIVGKEKTITGTHRAAEILHAFRHERTRLVEYNRHDALLVLEILEKLHLIELSVQRSLLIGLPPDRVAASIAAFDLLYLSALSRRNVVAPSVTETEGLSEQPGGHVLEPAPGLYRNAVVLDFRSLYPSIIRTFQIDPAGLLRHPPAADEDPIVAPNGAAFSREPAILPGLLDELFPRRAAAKARGDAVASHAIKILMNSFYGVLGTSACRFASPALVGAITGFGRDILLWSKARVEAEGFEVLYGDTDSLFVLSGADDVDEARGIGRRLAEVVSTDLAAHVQERWRVESRLEAEFERLYLRLLLPVARRSTEGARKRYAGLVDAAGGPEVEFTGLEVVRRDWTKLAKHVQRELYERLFTDRPVDAYLHRVVAELRAGRRDDQLVYRKGLRRPLETYTASTPPHVAAARRMSQRPGRVISYVITRDGPEPAGERHAPIDHEHYVQKQVRPVAEPVLTLLDLEFDAVIGDDRQMRLF